MTSDIVAGKSIIEIPLESRETAIILLSALEPETQSGPSDRAITRLTIKDTTLVIEVEAGDLTALRAAMNSYLAWVSACIKSIEYVS